MFLVSRSIFNQLKSDYLDLPLGAIDEGLRNSIRKINMMNGIVTFACCESHLETEEFPEYGSQFYVAFRASTNYGILKIKSIYKGFAGQLELMVPNPYLENELSWTNPRLEIDETCQVDGTDRQWSLVIRVTVFSHSFKEVVLKAFENAVNKELVRDIPKTTAAKPRRFRPSF
jgi:hypothetical protein